MGPALVVPPLDPPFLSLPLPFSVCVINTYSHLCELRATLINLAHLYQRYLSSACDSFVVGVVAAHHVDNPLP